MNASKKDNGSKPIDEELVYSKARNVMPGIEQIVKKILAQKKISVSESEARETVTNMYNYLIYFNSLDEYQTLVLGGIDIKEVKVLKEFQDFIVPAAVRFDPTDLRSKDVAIKETQAIMGTYNDYVNLCDTIRGYFKKDASTDTVSLAELKKSQTLVNVIGRASNAIGDEMRVNYGQQIYYPLRLEDITSLYEDRHFNATEAGLVQDYLATFRFN